MAASTDTTATLEPPPAGELVLRTLPAPAAPRRGSISRSDPWQSSDLTVSFPERDRLVFHSTSRFSSWRSPACRSFIEQSFGANEVSEVEVDTVARTATVVFGANSDLKY